MKSKLLAKMQLSRLHYLFLLTFFFNLVVVFIVYLLSDRLPPLVPLFYGKPQGDDQLASKSLLVLPSLLSVFISFTNLIIVRFINDDFLQKVLAGVVLASTALSAIATFKILFLVGNL